MAAIVAPPGWKTIGAEEHVTLDDKWELLGQLTGPPTRTWLLAETSTAFEREGPAEALYPEVVRLGQAALPPPPEPKKDPKSPPQTPPPAPDLGAIPAPLLASMHPAARSLLDAILQGGIKDRQASLAALSGLGASIGGAAPARTPTAVDLLDTLPWFRGAADWTAWRAFLCAVYALPMTAAELGIYQRCTGRTHPPTVPAREAWLPTGRRARKTAISALIGVWHAAYVDHRSYLAPGERGRVLLMAKNKADAKQLYTYALAILRSSPSLEALIQKETLEEISLSTGVDLMIKAVSLTAGRSGTVVAALLDEIAFWRSEESATPDNDVIDGIKPAMLMVPSALMLGLGSPYAKRGALWTAYKEHFGKEGDPVLVWQAPTVVMHNAPQIAKEVAAAYVTDAVSAAAEYGAAFRDDISAYVSEDVVDACVIPTRDSMPPTVQTRYFGFADPSGGLSDSYTLAIGHFDRMQRKIVLDLLAEWKAPFNPDTVSEEVSVAAKLYNLKSVTGDKYGGVWPRERLAAHGIIYETSERDKNAIYQNALPLLTGKGCELLDHARLKVQLCALERRTGRGRDIIDHPEGGHDDLVNAAMGVLLLVDDARKMSHPEAEVSKPRTVLEMHNQAVQKAIREAEMGSRDGMDEWGGRWGQ